MIDFFKGAAMISLVAPKRAQLVGGLWTPKVSGYFEEGDPTRTEYYISGYAEIKELNGCLKLFFDEVRVNFRKSSAQEEEESKKENEDEKDDDDDDSITAIAAPNNKSTETDTSSKTEEISDMYLYFVKKVPKARMVDVHKIGTKIHLTKYNGKGLFCRKGTIDTFEVSLKNIPDVLLYRGLAVVKLPDDKPRTEEPVVYGFIKFASARAMKIETANELHFTEINDVLSKALDRKAMTVGDTENRLKVAQRVKSLGTYRKAVKKCWIALNKRDADEITFQEAMKLLKMQDIFLVDTQARRIFEAVDIEGDRELGQTEFVNMLMAYDILGQTSDIEILDIYDSLKIVPTGDVEGLGAEALKSGFDFSGFIEALHMLGVHTEEEVLMKLFCSFANVKPKDLDMGTMQLENFKKAWAKVANVDENMKRRGLKPEDGMLGTNRNKDRLIRYVTDAENAYLQNISRINAVVEKIKKERREKKDAKRIAEGEYRDGLQREAAKFTALRNQEKRLVLKREQEDKNKKRLEEKVLRNKLLQKQAQNRLNKQEELEELLRTKSKLRSDQIRAFGLDRLDISIQNLREMPNDMYKNSEGQLKLSYLVVFDASRNKIDYLPEAGFLFWLTALKNFKLSQNRIQVIPNEVECLNKLEILELDSNRLRVIPEQFGALSLLQRLDLSNNHIETLPSSFGSCNALRYLNIHSNRLTHLPHSLGNCIRLEYIDVSNNTLRELPEGTQYLASLYHLNARGNCLSALPQFLGSCASLAYLDISCNNIVFLPPTFSTLRNLAYCNLSDNDIAGSVNRFNECVSLKELNFHKNSLRFMHSDIGCCTALEKLDLTNNDITSLPLEIGLLVNLIELKLSYNKMESIPPELGSCNSLQHLEIHHNCIRGPLPETMGLIESLRYLDVSFNNIDGIPRSIIGLVELRAIKLESNSINSIPDTLLTLSNLTSLDFSKNRFTRFPIELRKMSNLKALILENNSLTLLPRHINEMTMLHTLDLSKNQLRSVPVEFADILETVPTVNLAANPWNDLPQKWGKMWAQDRVVDCPFGNSVAEAVDFLYGMRIFYNTAEVIWQELGPMHYMNKLGLSDFIQELRERLPRSWHEGLGKSAEYVYFKVYPIITNISS